MHAVVNADTHVGLRSNNEDWYGAFSDIGLFAIADGMGGYCGGEVASRIAIDALDSFYRELNRRLARTPDDVSENDTLILAQKQMDLAFKVANRLVQRKQKGEFSKMGSTLSALLVRGDRALIGHIGDSRIYRFRGGQLEQLTTDHSLVATMRAAGIESDGKRLSHIILKAIGMTEEPPDVITQRVEPFDKFLLCTDGLTDVVDVDGLTRALADLPASEVCTTLVEEALARGGDDNITALLVEMRPDGPSQHPAPTLPRTIHAQ